MDKGALAREMILKIHQVSNNKFNVMEVCGTHTQAISKLGIRNIVEPKIHLLSGPGCPVCVTPEAYIDSAIEILEHPNVILATFGDMMKVKGSRENLINQREKGKEIVILYSPLDLIKLAKENSHKEIVFLAVGFETTTPLIALAAKMGKKRGIKNLSFLLGMKRMEPILHHILSEKDHNIQGLICPGHVAAIKGEKYFEFISEKYNIPAVIAGFEELDIIGGIYFLAEEQKKLKKGFKNLYKSCVTYEGNERANKLMEEVFTYSQSQWRGIGNIEASGFAFREDYKTYDALEKFNIRYATNIWNTCVCGDILLGKKLPSGCEFFGINCTPEFPIGPCMVSLEGACSIFYRYKGSEENE